MLKRDAIRWVACAAFFGMAAGVALGLLLGASEKPREISSFQRHRIVLASGLAHEVDDDALLLHLESYLDVVEEAQEVGVDTTPLIDATARVGAALTERPDTPDRNQAVRRVSTILSESRDSKHEELRRRLAALIGH